MSKFSCLFFWPTPSINLKPELYIHGELLIASHLDQSLWSTNQKYWATVRCNLLHVFREVHNCVAPFTSHSKLHEFGAGKPISWAKPAHFDLFAINFTVWESHTDHRWRCSKEMMLIKKLSAFNFLGLSLSGWIRNCVWFWVLYDWVGWFLEALAGSDHVNQTIVYYKTLWFTQSQNFAFLTWSK
jgi:hypothetical protein